MVNKAESGNWDSFVELARQYLESGTLWEEELSYKEEIGQRLGTARYLALKRDDGWLGLMLKINNEFKGNPVYYEIIDRFNDWCRENPNEALDALHLLWADDASTPSERIMSFSEKLPESVAQGGGSRVSLISYLLLGLDVSSYPLVKYTEMNKACKMAGFESLVIGSDEITYYIHTARFLERFRKEARKRGVDLHNLLEAQSAAWLIARGIEENPESDIDLSLDTYIEDLLDLDFDKLAEDLYVPVGFLEEIETLLDEKKQIIFQGPPGTGKTFIAQQLAKCLAGSGGRVTFVQFHPSYAYEDFVQGFRPRLLKNEQTGFEVKDGPLLQAAKRAQDSGSNHYLIIDEINRGNLAKVLGELYFLLEYRDEEISLQYSDDLNEKFSLPDNLFIIGTMNTADRSIASVDMALRRRFYFVEFYPDEEPVKSVLRKWLQWNAPDMDWVADVVNRANNLLKDDRHAAIGPSYFMRPGLNDGMVERIWKHSVLPYIEELIFNNPERMSEFKLDKLKEGMGSGKDQEDDGGEE